MRDFDVVKFRFGLRGFDDGRHQVEVVVGELAVVGSVTVTHLNRKRKKLFKALEKTKSFVKWRQGNLALGSV